MATRVTTHIEIDEEGVAWITSANTKVIEVVLDKLAYGWSPEEIHFQHPHLSLAQIHSALAYYYENQEKLMPRSSTGDKRLRLSQQSGLIQLCGESSWR